MYVCVSHIAGFIEKKRLSWFVTLYDAYTYRGVQGTLTIYYKTDVSYLTKIPLFFSQIYTSRFWVCAFLWCRVSLCVPFTNFLIHFCFIMKIMTIIGIVMLNCTLRLSVTKRFLFCKCATPLLGWFRPWTFPLNNGLNESPSCCFMSCFDSLLVYSTGEFQALQLTVLAVFGAVD